MFKVIDNLNTLVAKNWSRFDYFLDMISAFGMGEPAAADSVVEDDRIGLEFLFK